MTTQVTEKYPSIITPKINKARIKFDIWENHIQKLIGDLVKNNQEHPKRYIKDYLAMFFNKSPILTIKKNIEIFSSWFYSDGLNIFNENMSLLIEDYFKKNPTFTSFNIAPLIEASFHAVCTNFIEKFKLEKDVEIIFNQFIQQCAKELAPFYKLKTEMFFLEATIAKYKQTLSSAIMIYQKLGNMYLNGDNSVLTQVEKTSDELYKHSIENSPIGHSIFQEASKEKIVTEGTDFRL